jgi:hypothetical protein
LAQKEQTKVIIYDSVSFKLSKDEVARAAVVQFVTTTSEQIAIGMSGEGFENLPERF